MVLLSFIILDIKISELQYGKYDKWEKQISLMNIKSFSYILKPYNIYNKDNH